MFDLSEFDADVLATLTFNVAASIAANGEVTGQNLPACNATTLGMGTGTDFYAYDNPVALPPCGQPQIVDATSQARAWSTTATPISASHSLARRSLSQILCRTTIYPV